MLAKVSIDDLDYSNPSCFKSLFSHYKGVKNFKWTELKLTRSIIKPLIERFFVGNGEADPFLIGFLEKFSSIACFGCGRELDVLTKSLKHVLASPNCKLITLDIAVYTSENLLEILKQKESLKIQSLNMQISLNTVLNAQALDEALQNLFENGSLHSFGLDINFYHTESHTFWESFRKTRSFKRITRLRLKNASHKELSFTELDNLKILDLTFLSNSLIAFIASSTTLKELKLVMYQSFDAFIQAVNQSTSVDKISLKCVVPRDQDQVIDFNLIAGKNADISVNSYAQKFEKLRGIERITELTLRLDRNSEESVLEVIGRMKYLTNLQSLSVEGEYIFSMNVFNSLLLAAIHIERFYLSVSFANNTSVLRLPVKPALVEFFKKTKAREVDFSSDCVSFYFSLMDLEMLFEDGVFSRDCSVKSFAFTVTRIEKEADFRRFFEVLATQKTSLNQISLHVNRDQLQIIEKWDIVRSAFANYVGPISKIEIVGNHRASFIF